MPGCSQRLADTLQHCVRKQCRVPGAAVHYGSNGWLVADGAGAVGNRDRLGL